MALPPATLGFQATDARARRRKAMNVGATIVCLGFALLAIFPLVDVLWQLWERGHGALSWEFLSQPPHRGFDLTTGTPTFTGGIWHAIVGTGMVVGIGTLLGAPFGIAAGIYLSEYGRNRVGDVLRTATDAMAGVPSIVAGLFGFAAVSMFLTDRPPYMAWTGGIALAVLMLPTVTRTTEEALRTVPQSLRDASLALGAPRWHTTFFVVVPMAWGAMATGLLLGVARIAGETAPLLLTVLTSFYLVTDPSQSVATLPGLVYDYVKSAYPELNDQGWGAALVLITMVLAVNLLVRALSRRRNTNS